MARQQIGRFQQEAHLRGLHIVGVLDNLSEALEPIAREQSSATPGCVERLSYRTCEPLKPLPQALDCRSGFLSVGWLGWGLGGQAGLGGDGAGEEALSSSSWYSDSTFTLQMSWAAPSTMFSTASMAVNMEWSWLL